MDHNNQPFEKADPPPDPEDPLGILQTPRLILTRLQNAHVPALVELWTDPESTRMRVAIKTGMRLEQEIVRPGGAVRIPYAENA
jgi:hypothetical protein